MESKRVTCRTRSRQLMPALGEVWCCALLPTLPFPPLRISLFQLPLFVPQRVVQDDSDARFHIEYLTGTKDQISSVSFSSGHMRRAFNTELAALSQLESCDLQAATVEIGAGEYTAADGCFFHGVEKGGTAYVLVTKDPVGNVCLLMCTLTPFKENNAGARLFSLSLSVYVESLTP